MNPRWYDGFFSGLTVEFWNGCVPPEQTAAEVDFLAAELGLVSGSRVLDLPCGGGRHAVAFAERGHHVTGIDLSTEFLTHAAAAARLAGVDVEWRHEDMCRLHLAAEFDAVVCLGNSFGYAEHQDTERFLRAAAAALLPGGRLAIDTGTLAESLLQNLEERMWLEAGGVLLLIHNEYDTAHSRLDTEYTFIRGEQREVRHSAHHVHTLAEVGRMLAAAGLELRAVHADLTPTPFELGAPRAILLAEKAG